jgi:hypothetical protein
LYKNDQYHGKKRAVKRSQQNAEDSREPEYFNQEKGKMMNKYEDQGIHKKP